MRAETIEGQERQRNKETRLEDAPSPALQQTATHSHELSQAAVLLQRRRKRSRPRVANAACKATSASL